MTNRDRDSVAQLLEQVAQRLADAPAQTKESAKAYASRSGTLDYSAHQAGGLEQACLEGASAIRSYIASYLTGPKNRGKR